MTNDAIRPLSDLVAQGWEVQGFQADSGTGYVTFLLRRQRVHKMLSVRRKMRGGYVVKEFEI